MSEPVEDGMEMAPNGTRYNPTTHTVDFCQCENKPEDCPHTYTTKNPGAGFPVSWEHKGSMSQYWDVIISKQCPNIQRFEEDDYWRRGEEGSNYVIFRGSPPT